jgi:hypothetical protein
MPGRVRPDSPSFDVTQRPLRGNLPQAFVHALLLESAIAQNEHQLNGETKRTPQ